MSKVKVLQAARVYPPSVGGVEQVTQLLAERLREVCDTEVLVSNIARKFMDEIFNGIRVVRAKNYKTVWSLPLAPSYIRLFKRMSKGKDIVQLHYPFPIGEIAYLLSGYKGKTFVWWHGEIVRQKLALPFYRPIVNAVLRRANGVMVASKQQIDASQFLGDYREKCYIVPFGIDVDSWSAVDGDGFYDGVLTDSESVVLLHVGRLSPQKGLTFLIEALPKTHGCEVVLVGGGGEEQALREQAERLDVSSRIHFMEPRFGDELMKAYAGCDVFVFPTLWDSFGLVQIEAMACGKPVINTWLDSAVPHVSLDGVTGFTVPPRDADALAEAIQRFVDDPELRKRYGRAAYERARKEYSIERMMADVRGIYGV